MKLILTLLTAFTFVPASSFFMAKQHQPMKMMPTTTAPPREKTRTGRKTRRRRNDPFGTPYEREGEFDRGDRSSFGFRADFLGGSTKGKLEYLRDNADVSCEDDDPFHILLMGSTFDEPRVNIEYVSVSLSYVLGMPADEARDHSQFACDQGMSCLGTWTHKECVELGGKLQARDIVCRVVPYSEGSFNGWQAKNTEGSSGDVPQFDSSPSSMD